MTNSSSFQGHIVLKCDMLTLALFKYSTYPHIYNPPSNLSPSLSLYFPTSLCLYLDLSLAPSLSLNYLPVSPPTSLCLSIYLSRIYLSLSLSLPPYVILSISLSLPTSLCHSIHFSLFLSIYFPPSISVSLSSALPTPTSFLFRD